VKKPRQFWSNVKSLLICFFDIEGIVHKGQTVNGKFYCNVLRRLRKNIRRELPDKWCNNSWTLHHENAPAHASLFVQHLLVSTNTTVIPHPPYSTDITLCDFCLFLKMILKLQWQCFDSTEEIQTESQDMMKTLTQNDFQQCFQPWKVHWNQSINAEGDYFKGDRSE